MDTSQYVALAILCAIPVGIYIRCWYRDRSRKLDRDIDAALLLANGLDDYDEDGTDLEMERRIGKHRKECGQQ